MSVALNGRVITAEGVRSEPAEKTHVLSPSLLCAPLRRMRNMFSVNETPRDEIPRLAGWLAGQMKGWLDGWLAGWLAG